MAKKVEEVLDSKIEVEEETVQVKKSELAEMITKLDKLTKDSELLFKASDKQRIAKAMNEGGEILIKQAKISTWDDTGKLIVGWKLISDRCEVVLGRWVEEQNVTFIFEDGEAKTVPLLEFYRKTLKKISGDIISKTDEYDSQNNKIQIFKIQFPNGKTLLINSSFIN